MTKKIKIYKELKPSKKIFWVLGLFQKKTNKLVAVSAENLDEFYSLNTILPEDLVCKANLPISLNYFRNRKEVEEVMKNFTDGKMRATLFQVNRELEVNLNTYVFRPIKVSSSVYCKLEFEQ